MGWGCRNEACVWTGRDGNAGGQPSPMQLGGVSHRAHGRKKSSITSTLPVGRTCTSNAACGCVVHTFPFLSLHFRRPQYIPYPTYSNNPGCFRCCRHSFSTLFPPKSESQYYYSTYRTPMYQVTPWPGILCPISVDIGVQMGLILPVREALNTGIIVRN